MQGNEFFMGVLAGYLCYFFIDALIRWNTRRKKRKEELQRLMKIYLTGKAERSYRPREELANVTTLVNRNTFDRVSDLRGVYEGRNCSNCINDGEINTCVKCYCKIYTDGSIGQPTEWKAIGK